MPFSVQVKDGAFEVKLMLLGHIYSVVLHLQIIGILVYQLLTFSSFGKSSISYEIFALNVQFWRFAAAVIALSSVISLEKEQGLLNDLCHLYQRAVEALSLPEKNKIRIHSLTVGFLSTLYCSAFFIAPFLEFNEIGFKRVIFNASVIFPFTFTTLHYYRYQYTLFTVIKICQNHLDITAQNVNDVLCTFITTAKINRRFNQLYRIPMFFLNVICVLTILVCSYKIGVNSSLRETVYKVDNRELLSCLFVIVQLLMFSSIGSWKEKQSSSLLHTANAITSGSMGKLKRNGELLVGAISSLPMNLSAGFFTVNYSFLITMFGVTITYLVILIQFQEYAAGKTAGDV